jgi:hypothetical protein
MRSAMVLGWVRTGRRGAADRVRVRVVVDALARGRAVVPRPLPFARVLLVPVVARRAPVACFVAVDRRAPVALFVAVDRRAPVALFVAVDRFAGAICIASPSV